MTLPLIAVRHTAPIPRPVRFAVVGIACAGLQLLLLHLLVRAGMESVVGNGIAFGASAQVNFALSTLFTWSDRDHPRAAHGWSGRLARFNLAVAVGATINETAFLFSDPAVHYLAASTLGIAAGASFSFVVGDRWVFPAPRPTAG